jgi:hypothetical protein
MHLVSQVAFGVAGALVPLMELWTDSLLIQFALLAAIATLTAFAIVLIPVPTYLGQSMDKKLGKNARAAAGGASGYWVEINLACSVFCLIGGKVPHARAYEFVVTVLSSVWCSESTLLYVSVN